MRIPDRRRRRLLPLLVPLAGFGTWQLAVAAGLVDLDYLPAPDAIIAAFAVLVGTGELAADLAHTVTVVLVATAAALALGGPVGFAIGLRSRVRTHVMASVDFLRSIPAVALVPVAVLIFGPGATTELVLATYAATWPILVNTVGGVAAVPPRLHDVARMLRLPPAATLRKIVIPAAVPACLVGARIAAMTALLVAVLTEMIISVRGLGGGLVESLLALDPARMWAYALVCGIVGALLNAALRRLVRHGLPGSTANRPQAGQA